MAASQPGGAGHLPALTPLGDDALAHLAGEGDAGAFEELCQRHCWTAWEIAYAINGDSRDAAQSVSAAFAKLFAAERDVQYHEPERIRAAILSTARAAAIETARRSGKEGGGEPYEVTGIRTHDRQERPC